MVALSHTIAAKVPCKVCGTVRQYTVGDVKRNRIAELCQPCAVKAYNASRPPRDLERKKAATAAWYQANKNHCAKYYSDYREKLKRETIAAYGGKCVVCGETDFVVLVLDHIHDDAKQDRNENKHNGGYKMYQYLKRENWPKGKHQVLCHNCNFRKEYFRRKDAVKNRKAS